MTVFTRKVPDGDVLNTLDLRYATKDPLYMQFYIKTWLTLMRTNKSDCVVLSQSSLNGYQSLPDRYWIRTTIDSIMIFVEADPNEPDQRFVWKKGDGVNDIVVTKQITKDSIVILKVFGDTLSYANGNKLLFIECEQSYKHPIDIGFIDSFGLIQSVSMETGEWLSNYSNENTFRSLSGDIVYSLGKIGHSTLTVGDSSIPRELMLFYDGLVKSPAYVALVNNTAIDTAMSDTELTADTFTKLYSFASTLQFNTIDIPTLQMYVGEINIHDI